ncbi:MAG TPA: hypothetical protein VFT55_13655, partial [Planctomycetota bacterium]|nr:hypothetical protein [Planctomycetota bacterium]
MNGNIVESMRGALLGHAEKRLPQVFANEIELLEACHRGDRRDGRSVEQATLHLERLQRHPCHVTEHLRRVPLRRAAQFDLLDLRE